MASTHPMLSHAGLGAHNDRYLHLANEKRNWQLTAGLSLLLASVLTVALVYQSGQRKEYAYVVEVDDLGVARYIRDLPQETIQNPYIVQAQVARFIRDIRTVTTDGAAWRNQLNESYALCLRDAQTYIKNDFDQTKPAALIQKGMSVFPHRIRVEAKSATEFRVYWIEEAQQQGAPLPEAHWEATVHVELTPPAELTAAQRALNPLGIWIRNISWFKTN